MPHARAGERRDAACWQQSMLASKVPWCSCNAYEPSCISNLAPVFLKWLKPGALLYLAGIQRGPVCYPSVYIRFCYSSWYWGRQIKSGSSLGSLRFYPSEGMAVILGSLGEPWLDSWMSNCSFAQSSKHSNLFLWRSVWGSHGEKQPVFGLGK